MKMKALRAPLFRFKVQSLCLLPVAIWIAVSLVNGTCQPSGLVKRQSIDFLQKSPSGWVKTDACARIFRFIVAVGCGVLGDAGWGVL